MSGRKAIIDEFTDLPISKQRKYQLRHPEKDKVRVKKQQKTDQYRKYQREYQRAKRASQGNL